MAQGWLGYRYCGCRVACSSMESMSFVSSTGSRLAALVWDGDPSRSFVLVHGLASNAQTWIEVGHLLNSTGAKVVAYDQRSHGQSDRVESGFDFPTYVADLQAVIEQSTSAAPVTVGQSWGGNVVVEHAVHHQTAAVIGVDGGFIRLADQWPDWEECAQLLAPPQFGRTNRSAIEGYLRTAHPDWSDTAIDGTLENFATDEQGAVTPHLSYGQHMLVLQSLWQHDPAPALATIQTPTRAIAARPSLRPESDVEQMGFDDVVWLDGDHDLHLQQPQVVSELILETTRWDR